ncbi:armadillo-type protein [Paraphysoderma sedebokerense]|nr:armadillo-type protein [Paraphysoderma sedebokerense]
MLAASAMITVDPSVISQVGQALNAQLSSVTTKDQRDAARNYLEEFSNSSAAPQYGYYLAHKSNNQDEFSRFYGLKCLETAICYKWTTPEWTDHIRSQIVSWIEDLVLTGLNPYGIEKNLIKEKLSSLCVELAKREWPYNWNLNAFLFRLYSCGPAQQEMALLILRGLSEDIHDVDFADSIVEKRKKDLVRALNNIVLPFHLFQALLEKECRGKEGEVKAVAQIQESLGMGWLERIISHINECGQNLKRPGLESTDSFLYQKMMTLLLDTLERIVTWVMPKAVVELNVLVTLTVAMELQIPLIAKHAAQCLQILFARSYGQLEDRCSLFDPFFDGGGLQRVFDVIRNLAGDLDSPDFLGVKRISGDEYDLLKELAEGLAKLGIYQLCWKKNLAWKPNNVSSYFQILFYLSQHPSPVIPHTINQFWIAAVKHEFISQDTSLPTIIPPLLNSLLPRLHRSKPEPGSVVDYFYSEEFESATESSRLFAQFLSCTRQMIKAVVEWKPLESVKWIESRVPLLLNQPIMDTRGKDASGLFTREAPYAIIFHSHMLMLEYIATSVPQSIVNPETPETMSLSSEITAVILSLVERLLTFSTPEPVLLKSCLIGVLSCTSYLRKYENAARSVVSWLFEGIKKCRTPRFEDYAMTALASLPKIANCVADAVMPYYRQYAEIVQTIIPLIPGFHVHYLYEFLLLVNQFSSATVASKQPNMQEILDPVLQEWHQIATANFHNPDLFMQSVGVEWLLKVVIGGKQGKWNLDNLPTPLMQEYEAFKQFKAKLNVCSTLLNAFLSRSFLSQEKYSVSTELFQVYMERLSEIVLLQIRSIHQFFETKRWESMPPELKKIIGCPDFVKVTLLKRNDTTQYPDYSTHQAKLSDLVRRLQNWIEQLRITSYSLLGTLTSAGSRFYSTQLLDQKILNCVFGSVEDLSYRHWQFLMKHFLEPFALNCPYEKRDVFLGSVLPPLLRFLLSKLDTEWTKIMEKESDDGVHHLDSDDVPEEDELTDDIIQQKIFGSFSRTYTEMLVKWCSVGKGKKDSLSLFKFCISQPQIAEPLFYSAIHILTYRDTHSASKAAALSKDILLETFENPQFHQFLGQEMMTAALKSLHSPYHSEMHVQLINLITQIYIHLRPLTDIPCKLFCTIPGVSAERMMTFDAELPTKESKHQERMMAELLKGFTGVSVSASGKKTLAFKLRAPQLVTVVAQGSRDPDMDVGGLFREM